MIKEINKNSFQVIIINGLIFSLVFSFSLAALAADTTATSSSSSTTSTTATDSKEAEKKADKIDDLQDKIDKLEDQIDQKRQKERTIADQIQIIDQSVESTKLEMQKSQKLINSYNEEINQMTVQVDHLAAELEKKKANLGEYLFTLDQSSSEMELVLMDQGAQLEDYFGFMDNLEKMQDEMRRVLDDVAATKKQLEDQREVVLEKKGEQYQIYLMQDDQKNSLEESQEMKERLLSKTQKDISLMSVEKDELKKQLNALQSLGVSISMDDAISAAKYASEKTGVRTAFLLGVLRVESNMGQNVGGGRYKTDMNPAQHDTFKAICKELGLKPENMPVSRRVCYNKGSKDGCGGWGGAMGPAQFMPSTWMGYKDKVAKVTGNKTPNPWNIKDALVAMGLKLSAVSGVTSGKASAERQAACMYLAGGNWKNYTWYGDRVLYYADGFDRYMKE